MAYQAEWRKTRYSIFIHDRQVLHSKLMINEGKKRNEYSIPLWFIWRDVRFLFQLSKQENSKYSHHTSERKERKKKNSRPSPCNTRIFRIADEIELSYEEKKCEKCFSLRLKIASSRLNDGSIEVDSQVWWMF